MDTRKDLSALDASRGPLYLERATRELSTMLDAQWTPQSAVQLAFEQILLSTDVESLLATQPTGEGVCELFETVLRIETQKSTVPEASDDAEGAGSSSGKGGEIRSAGYVDGDSLIMGRPPTAAVAGSTRRSRYARVLTELLDRPATRNANCSGKQDGSSRTQVTAVVACLARLKELTQAAIA